MDQRLAYIPADRRLALAHGYTLPTESVGTALVADISGFTPFTEALTQAFGPRRGAETLMQHVNALYEALITIIHQYGGVVMGFAGDSVLVWFDDDDSSRALNCAHTMHSTMHAFDRIALLDQTTTALRLKIALAAGPVHRWIVGDPAIQCFDLIVGATLDRMVAAEQCAQPGEIVADGITAAAFAPQPPITAWRAAPDDISVAVFAAQSAPCEPIQPIAAQGPSITLPSAVLDPWVPLVLRERLKQHDPFFLTQLRPAVIMFVSFGGLDYDHDPSAEATLDESIRWIQRQFQTYGGMLLGVCMGDKGGYLYGAFGVPHSYEDDAVRAVLAAQTLQSPPHRLRMLTPPRIGISLGLVQVGFLGGTQAARYGVQGDEVNVAARLMEHAQPGELIVSGRVQVETAHAISWTPRTAVRFKGKSKDISIFCLRNHAPRTMLRLSEPAYALPMIGRDAELAAILPSLERALTGYGQIVEVIGDAGIGKSRLVAEVIGRAYGQGFKAYGGACPVYGETLPYAVWQPIWCMVLNLLGADAREPQQQLTHWCRIVHPEHLPFLPLIGAMLGLPLPETAETQAMTAPTRKATLETMLLTWLPECIAGCPTLFILEDCHWMDALSRDLLQQVTTILADLPLCILITTRPMPSTAPHHYSSPLPNQSSITLGALSQSEMLELATLKQTFWDSTKTPIPADRLPIVVDRVQGNPLYLCELMNYLETQNDMVATLEPDRSLQLPDSVHRLILSKIDQLTPTEQGLLKLASVIGRQFGIAWLEGSHPSASDPEVIAQAMAVLVAHDLIQPDPTDETQDRYVFNHSITQEVVYESLSSDARALLHEHVAAYWEIISHSQLIDTLDLIAHHYAHSSNTLKAFEYLYQKADRAARMFDNATAIEEYEAAIERLQHMGYTSPTRYRHHITILIKLVTLTSFHEKTDNAVRLAQAETLIQALESRYGLDDSDQRLLARIIYWKAYRNLLRVGGYRDARPQFEQVWRIAERYHDAELLTLKALIVGRLSLINGYFITACPFLEAIADIPEPLESKTEALLNQGMLGLTYVMLGRDAEGFARLRQALAAADAMQNPTGAMYVHLCYAIAYAQGSDYQRLRDHSAQIVHLAERLNDLIYEFLGSCFHSLAFSRLGDHRTRSQGIERRQAITALIGFRPVVADWVAAYEAEMTLNAGLMLEAQSRAAQAVDLAELTDDPFALGMAHRTWAQALWSENPHQRDIGRHLEISMLALEQSGAVAELARTRAVLAFYHKSIAEP